MSTDLRRKALARLASEAVRLARFAQECGVTLQPMDRDDVQEMDPLEPQVEEPEGYNPYDPLPVHERACALHIASNVAQPTDEDRARCKDLCRERRADVERWQHECEHARALSRARWQGWWDCVHSFEEAFRDYEAIERLAGRE